MCSFYHRDVPVSGQQISLKVLMLLGLPASPWGGHCRKDSERYFGTWRLKLLAEVVGKRFLFTLENPARLCSG